MSCFAQVGSVAESEDERVKSDGGAVEGREATETHTPAPRTHGAKKRKTGIQQWLWAHFTTTLCPY